MQLQQIEIWCCHRAALLILVHNDPSVNCLVKVMNANLLLFKLLGHQHSRQSCTWHPHEGVIAEPIVWVSR